MKKECAYCGKEFHKLKETDNAWLIRRFCSVQCAGAARRQDKKRNGW